MTDETDPAPPADGSAEPTTPAATPPPLPSVTSAQIAGMWSKFGPVGQLIVGSSIAVILIAVVGGLIDAWNRTGNMVLLLVTAAIASLIAATLTMRRGSSDTTSGIPFETIEFAAGVVATVLALLRVLDVLFDLDELEDFGGPIGLVLTIAMAVAASGILAGALRRDPTLRAAVLKADRGVRLALAGFALVVIAWALNVSVSYWFISAGIDSVALATFGAVLIVVQPRWSTVLEEVPLGWVGAGFGLVSLLLGIGLWGELMNLGLTQLELDLTDYLPFVMWYLGIVGIIAGGILAGLPVWQARVKVPPPAVVTPPTTPPAQAIVSDGPPAQAPIAPAAPVEPPASPEDPPTPPA